MPTRRTLAAFPLWLLAGTARAAPASGFALIPPDAQSPKSEPSGTILRSAARALPNPPRPLRRIHVEGTLPHQGIYDESNEAKRDWPAARDLALAGRLTGEAKYTEAAARILAAWTAIYTPSFNPIDETGFDDFFFAWDLLPDPARAPLRAGMTNLLHDFAEGYPRQFLRGGTATNNWNSHRVKITTLASFALGDARLIAQARDRFARQLRDNIDEAGLTLDFTQRDALHYVVYDLEPLLMCCLAARRHNEDWTTLEDSRLTKALTWLIPYVSGQTEHEEFVNSRVSFDRTRREAGLKGFGGPFDPTVARLLYAMAARLDPTWTELARALRRNPWDDAWLEVVWPLLA